MRSKMRIPVILNIFKNSKKAYLNFIESEKDSDYQYFLDNFNDIEDLWKKSYDYRFGQLMINHFNMIDGNIWHKEEENWAVVNDHVLPEEIFTWTSYYDKDEERLDEPIQKYLKDLSTDHIRNIVKFVEEKKGILPVYYSRYFFKRLEDEG